MVDYKNLTKEELLKAYESNQEVLLKSKKVYRKLDSIVYLGSGASTLGLCMFVVSNNPILKLAGLCLGFATAIPGIFISGSNKYKTVKIEYETALKIEREINEAVDEIDGKELYE